MHYHYFTLEQRDKLARRIGAAGRGSEELLKRLHSADYGVCQSCGGDIPYRRLLEVPGEVRCAACAAP